MNKYRVHYIIILAVLLLTSGYKSLFAESKNSLSTVQSLLMPGGEPGAGFDDLQFASNVRQVLIPGGRTGKLFLINPETHTVTSIYGFSAEATYTGGHGEGITSADEGSGFIFVVDRSALTLAIIEPSTTHILASAALASGPDYVRYVAAKNEIWVTQPDNDRIEVFTLSKNEGTPSLIHSSFISVPGGPESLVIDNTKQRAYTHLWRGKTVAIDIKTRSILSTWPNGCAGSRGIALNETRNFLFAGCAEGKAVVLDTATGKQLSSLPVGDGVDIIGYNPALSHFYLAGADSQTLTVLNVSTSGVLSPLGTGKIDKSSHCVTGDNEGNIWVCDPDHGQILLFKDNFK